MDSKDAPESLEEGGGSARCRCSSARRTATVLLIQGLFTAACAAFSLNILFYQKPGPSTAQVRARFFYILSSLLSMVIFECRLRLRWCPLEGSVDYGNGSLAKFMGPVTHPRWTLQIVWRVFAWCKQQIVFDWFSLSLRCLLWSCRTFQRTLYLSFALACPFWETPGNIWCVFLCLCF